MSFTELSVRKINPPLKDDRPNQKTYLEKLKRGRGLMLVVSYGGTKRWRVLWYDAQGKARSDKLGRWPEMGVAAARRAAEVFNPHIATASKEAGSFRDVADEFLLRHVEAEGLRSKREVERHLRVYIYPRWERRPFFEIRRKEVNELLDEVADKHGRSMANAILATIRKLMNWYQTRDESYSSPIVRGMRRGRVVSRNRWLEDEEIRALWTATEKGTFGALVRVLLLTGQRREKVATMKWDDLEGDVWTIPMEVREKGTPGQITLPDLVLEVIERLPRVAGNPYVFAGRIAGRPATGFSARKRELDAAMIRAHREQALKANGTFEAAQSGPWRLHDLRRTCRRLMTRAEVPTEVAELALGHSIKGIQAVYDDPREYRDRVDDALRRVTAEVRHVVFGH